MTDHLTYVVQKYTPDTAWLAQAYDKTEILRLLPAFGVSIHDVVRPLKPQLQDVARFMDTILGQNDEVTAADKRWRVRNELIFFMRSFGVEVCVLLLLPSPKPPHSREIQDLDQPTCLPTSMFRATRTCVGPMYNRQPMLRCSQKSNNCVIPQFSVSRSVFLLSMPLHLHALCADRHQCLRCRPN